MTLRTLNYGNYVMFLIMGNAGFCPSTVLLLLLLLPLLVLLLLLLLATPPPTNHPALQPVVIVIINENDSCRRCKGSGPLSVTAAEVADAHLP